MLREVETEHDPEDKHDVPVDLNKLQRKTMNFTVFNIQEDLAFQLGQSDEIFITTNKKGNPVWGIPNARGN